MAGKITRIIINSLIHVFVALVLISFAFLLAIQSHTFQTWLGKKASVYLSHELETKIDINRIRINFFNSVDLQSVLIYDKYNDTLFNGNLNINIKLLNLKDQLLELKETQLSDATIKIKYLQKDSCLNLKFIIDYFSSTDTAAKGSEWVFIPGEFALKNITFSYIDETNTNSDKNHIDYKNLGITELDGRFNNLKIFGDSLKVEVNRLFFKEKSGFELYNLSTRLSINSKHLTAENLQLNTATSKIHGKIKFKYQDWHDYSDFIYKIELDCELLDSSKINTRDLAYFAEELDSLNQKINLAGKIKGTVNDLRLSNIHLALGNHTKYRGYLSVQGLPHLDECFIHLDAIELSTHYNDLIQIPSFPFRLNKPFPISDPIKSLGLITFKGKFDGFLSDFSTYGNFTTEIGNAETQLSLKIGEIKNDIKYSGKIKTQNFDLGQLFGHSSLHSISLNGELDGAGSNLNSLAAKFSFEIKNMSYQNSDFSNISIDGHIENRIFNGLMISLDTNLNFDFNGSIDFNKKVPDLRFTSTINRLDFGALKFFTKNDSGTISAELMIDTYGSSIDDLSGKIHLDNLNYKIKGNTYKLSNFDLDLNQETNIKKLELNSDYLNASINGRYELSRVYGVFQKFLHTYYPTFFSKSPGEIAYNDSLVLEINVKNFTTINALFLNDYMLSRGSRLLVKFNPQKNNFDLSGELPVFSYRDFTFYQSRILVKESGNHLKGNINTQAISFADSNLVNQVQLNFNSEDKNLHYALNWDNQDTIPNFGRLKGGMSFNPTSFELKCDTIQIKSSFNDWNLKSPSIFSWLNDGSLIVEPLVLINNEQELSITGKYNTSFSDSLTLFAESVDVGSFNPLLRIFGIKINGLLNGQMVFSDPNNVFVFRGQLHASNFKFNNNSLGDVDFKTDYDNKEKSLHISGYTSLGLGEYLGGSNEDIHFGGNYFLDGREESIDLEYTANTANLRLLNPLLEDILTIKNGFVKGRGKIHGNTKNIKIESKLNLFQSEILVNYTGVQYFVTGDIEILPDQIRFSDLLLRDRNMRSPVMGTLNGNLFHDNFKNIRIDYDINYKNMLVLNTTENDNPYYYGKVYGSGYMGIFGYINNLSMEINTTVNKNSKFILPLDGPAELNDEGYIQFVKKDTLKKIKEKSFTGFNLDMGLKIQPDAQLSILMDKKTGDVLNVQGTGNLELNINTLGKFDMVGDYIITEGEYLFTLRTLINKKFEIDAGSHITWSGDPMNAEIDITTRYRQRASVAPLLNDTSGMYGARQPVDCKLLISGKLATPNINFDIDVPNLEPTAMARIDNVLSDEAELNRQVFSFLLFRSFTVPQIYTSLGGGVSAGSAAASTGSEMLSNRASEFLNSYFGNLTGITDMQVGVNYRPGTTTTGEEFDVALSKQFMNNRVSIDGNFGVNTNPNNSSSGLIGDVVVEYKLSDDGKYRVKVFNQTNDNTQVTILGGPYTQGIGIFYREEFDTFKELIEYYKKKASKK